MERRSGGAPRTPLAAEGGGEEEEGDGGLSVAVCSVEGEMEEGGEEGGGGEGGDSVLRETLVPSRLSVEFSTELTGV